MKVGIEFTMKDGKKDSYDPVDQDEFKREQTETEYVIDNGFNVYAIKKADVASVRFYELCQTCGREVGTCYCQEKGGE